MVQREGLNFDEEEISCFRASFQILKRNQQGYQYQEFLPGELVLTQKGVVFLEFKGLLKTSRARHHAFDYDIIKAVRTESRGITRTLSREEFIVIEIESPGNPLKLKFSCHRDDSCIIKKSLEDRISFRMTTDQFHREILRLLKPATKANLNEIAQIQSIESMLRKILDRKSSTPENFFKAVVDVTRSLISDGQLDGVIDDSGVYISRISLSRKSIQYQVSIDFSSLFNQLKGKGIVLESLECPSCKGKLQYPESGSIISCTFCGASVSAVDVFEKFKALLEI